MKFRRTCVVICSWLRCTSLAVKSSSCSWSSMPTRSTYSTGLWIAATQAPTSSPQAASKLSLQSVAAGIKSDNVSVVCSANRRSAACARFLLCSHIHVFFVVFVMCHFMFIRVSWDAYDTVIYLFLSQYHPDFLSKWGSHCQISLGFKAPPQILLKGSLFIRSWPSPLALSQKHGALSWTQTLLHS